MRHLVIASGKLPQLGSAGVRLELLRVEQRSFPFVPATGVNPHGAIRVEIADEFGIVGEAAALAAGNIVAPVLEISAEKIGQPHFVVPLMRLGERQQVAIG